MILFVYLMLPLIWMQMTEQKTKNTPTKNPHPTMPTAVDK